LGGGITDETQHSIRYSNNSSYNTGRYELIVSRAEAVGGPAYSYGLCPSSDLTGRSHCLFFSVLIVGFIGSFIHIRKKKN
jgi:hypothetical protein